MGTGTRGGERHTVKHSHKAQEECSAIRNLLSKASYDAAASRFQHLLTNQELANNPLLAVLLAAAYQLCLTCHQCTSEASRYQQAHADAVAREKELQQQLMTILYQMEQLLEPASIEGNELDRTEGEKADGSSGHGHTMWQRVRNLWQKTRHLPAQEAVDQGKGETAVLPPEKELQEVPPTPSLAIYCLGPFRVYQNDQLLSEWNGQKSQMVFKYLITHRDKQAAKDTLMDLFWPEGDPDAARRNLHQAVYSLRQTLKNDNPNCQYILFENDCYLLSPEINLWIDYEEFHRHMEAGLRLEAADRHTEAVTRFGIAEGLYQGDFLEEDVYDECYKLQRQQLRNAYFDTANRLSEHYVRQGEHAAAIALCQKMLTYDNCCEEAHRRLMRCHLAQQQRHLAIRQFQFCQDTLKSELEVNPTEETINLYRQIAS